MPYWSDRNNEKHRFRFDVKEIVRVRTTRVFCEIQAHTLCDDMPCYLTDLGEYWEGELMALWDELLG